MTYSGSGGSNEDNPNMPSYPGTEGDIWIREMDQRKFRYTDITDDLPIDMPVDQREQFDGWDEKQQRVLGWLPIDHIREETVGEQGYPGIRGITGRRGEEGEEGNKGKTGPQGPVGAVGATGPEGNQGLMGPFGERGLSLCETIDSVPDKHFTEERGVIFMTKPKDNNRIFIATGL